MRFLLAIVLFVVAFATGGLGIAQRTILAPPDRVTSTLELATEATVTVIDGAALNAFEGRQTIAIEGGVTAPDANPDASEEPAEGEPADGDPVVEEVPAEGEAAEGEGADGEGAEGDAADGGATEDGESVTETDAIAVTYGRTVDVLGWVGAAQYTLVTFDAEEQQLVARTVRGTEQVVPNPIGSDLWFGEFEGEGDLGITLNVPDDISLLIVSDGTLPAPQGISVTWPLDASTPYSMWLILAGGASLVLGLLALLWALLHMRKQRGPRRKTPKMPKAPRPSAYRPTRQRAVLARPKGRRAVRRVAMIPTLLLGGSLALTACTGSGLPIELPSPSPSVPDEAPEPETPPIAVNERQLERIVARISERITEADTELDASIAETRMTGPALELREASYAVRAEDDDLGALPAIPVGEVQVALPQQTDIWPRTVFAIVEDPEEETVPPLALVLIQDDPRSQYKVHYAVTLVPAEFPPSPPATIGTARLPADTPLLSVLPADVTPAYADLLLQGEESETATLFDVANDALVEQIGAGAKDARRDDLPETAAIDFTNEVGEGETVVLATNDTGGLVTGYIIETETVTPVQSGATVNASGAVEALSGEESSSTGFIARYGVQVLFYVPPLGSTEPIQLLGFTQGLIDASEVP